MLAHGRLRRPQHSAWPPLGACIPGRLVLSVLIPAFAFALVGCAREHPGSTQPLAISVRAAADTGRMERLEIRPPRPARAWLARVTPAPAGALTPPLPAAEPDTLLPETAAPPTLDVEPGLLPPVLRDPARLVLPAARHSRSFESVELDVRVNKAGEVTDVLEAGGGADPALVEAARACVLRMRFYPARRAGEPVAVWCRQRFDFGADAGVRP